MEVIKNGTLKVGWDIGVESTSRHVTKESDICGGSRSSWRSSEIEAAAVALSSSRCAAAKV